MGKLTRLGLTNEHIIRLYAVLGARMRKRLPACEVEDALGTTLLELVDRPDDEEFDPFALGRKIARDRAADAAGEVKRTRALYQELNPEALDRLVDPRRGESIDERLDAAAVVRVARSMIELEYDQLP